MDKNHVLNLINNGLTKEQAEKLDDYFCKNVSELADNFNANETISVINNIYDVLNYSICVLDYLSYVRYFNFDTLCTKYSEEELIKAKRYFEVINNCEAFLPYDHVTSLGLRLGHYYYYEGDYDLALKYYSAEFEDKEFNYDEYEFFYKFENYLDLSIKKYGKETTYLKIKDFVDNGVNKLADSIDFAYVTTHYLSYDFNNKLYDYTHKIISKQVDDYRKRRGEHLHFSDTDEERALCELICVKFKHLIEIEDFENALNTYHELTNEIHLSDCTRYYHARDKFYNNLIAKMQKHYPNLRFFNTEIYVNSFTFDKLKFKSTPNFDTITTDTFTLINPNGLEYDFTVCYYEKDTRFNIQPLLPFGKGAILVGNIEKDENGDYYVVPIY